MKIEVNRKTYSDICTIGEMYIDNEFFCYTLEDCMREVVGSPIETWKVQGKTAIPVGTYEVIIDFSHRFQRTMPHILDVPGFTGIRIHCGNDSGDTEGCLLVGNVKYNDSIAESRLAYNALLEEISHAIKDGEKVEISISNA